MIGESPAPNLDLIIHNGCTIIKWTPDKERPRQISDKAYEDILYLMSRGTEVYLTPANNPNIIVESNNKSPNLVEYLLKNETFGEICIKGSDNFAMDILGKLYVIIGPEGAKESDLTALLESRKNTTSTLANLVQQEPRTTAPASP